MRTHEKQSLIDQAHIWRIYLNGKPACFLDETGEQAVIISLDRADRIELDWVQASLIARSTRQFYS